MGRRHWQGKRRIREAGIDGDGSWCCMRGALKRKLLREAALRRELAEVRRATKEVL